MIEKLNNLPGSVLGFSINKMTKKDFLKRIIPEVSQEIEKNPEIDFLYILEQEPAECFGIWFEDAIRKVQNIGKWNKTAFITDSEKLDKHVDNFQNFMKGDYRIFKKNEKSDAMKWLSKN